MVVHKAFKHFLHQPMKYKSVQMPRRSSVRRVKQQAGKENKLYLYSIHAPKRLTYWKSAVQWSKSPAKVHQRMHSDSVR